jgi:hypothetical protein
MVSLLFVSLALSTSASIPAQAPAATVDPLLVASQPFVQIQPNGPSQPFDNMEIHPDPEVCYKIRAYWFTKGENPRFLRETTCGPTRTNAKQMKEVKPGLMPLDLKATPDRTPQE